MTVQAASNIKKVPSNFGPIKEANANSRLTGPCGDTMEIWLSINDGKIQKSSFITDGCIHSMICGSAAVVMAMGTKLDVAEKIEQQDILAMTTDIPEESSHCALLAVNTLKRAIGSYKARLAEVEAKAKTCNPGENDCGSCGQESCDSRTSMPQNNISRIQRKIVVMSGKGGVGKSTVAVNLAKTFAGEGKKVGLLDIDIHGPSIPTMLGLGNQTLQTGKNGLLPVEYENMKIMSIGFLLPTQDDAVIWRGPMKHSIIKQFIQDVEWGELDYLIVDCPPGTGDELLAVTQLLSNVDGAVLVTTPQGVATVDVFKSVDFCRKVKLPILGVIENMSGFICSKCGETTNIFGINGGRKLADRFNVSFLGAIPIDSQICSSGDQGSSFMEGSAESIAASKFMNIVLEVKKCFQGTTNIKQRASAN
jgi:ATP-binding protein involved in chromosome partitioning